MRLEFAKEGKDLLFCVRMVFGSWRKSAEDRVNY